ncbi:MAG: 4Fe-4S binding protein [Anaerolineaceae bacterium]|nr:4Fe-4S binding protein [Anaerolineaceae bacterium]
MSRPLWFVEIIKHHFTDRFEIAGWTRKSKLIRSVVDFFLFRGDQIYYLPKDEVVESLNEKRHAVKERSADTLRADESLVVENQDGNLSISVAVNERVEQEDSIALPSSVVRQFIEEANYVWLMNKCLCRDSMQCKDYPIDLGCIFLGEAVLKINPKLGYLATKEEAIAKLERAEELGLVHLIGKNKIDVQWMGVNPGHKLMTICNCCPCCCLYKVLPDLDDSISEKVSKMPGVAVWIEEEECIGCGRCTQDDICMTHNLRLEAGKAVMGNHCIGCGRCYEVCPTGAIHFEIQNDQYVNEAIEHLKAKVDVR